jgi:hypothetical protein
MVWVRSKARRYWTLKEKCMEMEKEGVEDVEVWALAGFCVRV